MAIFNQGFDITMKASDYCKTSAAQYKVVGMNPNTTAADMTAYMCNAGSTLDDSCTAQGAFGIIQDLPNAGSTEVNVRTMGISKAICAGSIAAGDFIYADYTASTTTKCGKVLGAIDITASNEVSLILLGRALEDGSSDTVISVVLYPTLHNNI